MVKETSLALVSNFTMPDIDKCCQFIIQITFVFVFIDNVPHVRSTASSCISEKK
jgi:hypothetical protein